MVVLAVHQVDRGAGFRLARRQHGPMDVHAVHARPAVLGQQTRMDVEDAALPPGRHGQLLQPAAEADHVRTLGLGGPVAGLGEGFVRFEVLPHHHRGGKAFRLQPGEAIGLGRGGEPQHRERRDPALAAPELCR